MPQPTTIEAPDWRKIFLAGKSYTDWVRAVKNPDNAAKMEDLRHSLVIPPEVQKSLNSLSREVHIVCFAEDTAQDVLRFVPVLQALAQSAERISIRYLSREAFPQIFVRYLTNGAESLPKFIFLNEEFTECGNWGPLPRECKNIIARGRACNNVSRAREKVSAKLAADPKQLVPIDELAAEIQIAAAKEP